MILLKQENKKSFDKNNKRKENNCVEDENKNSKIKDK